MRYSNHIVDETTHAFKCAKWFALVSSLLLGIFGTVLLIWPNTSMNVICTLLGVLMVVFGVSKIVGYFFNVSYHIGFQFDLALGLFALLFGAGIEVDTASFFATYILALVVQWIVSFTLNNHY